MGLPRFAQDLVIRAWAEQTNHSFVLSNAPVPPPALGELQDDLVLREVALPTAVLSAIRLVNWVGAVALASGAIQDRAAPVEVTRPRLTSLRRWRRVGRVSRRVDAGAVSDARRAPDRGAVRSARTQYGAVSLSQSRAARLTTAIGICSGQLEQVERDALGRLGTDTRESAEFVNERLDRRCVRGCQRALLLYFLGAGEHRLDPVDG